jgi:hypothetical protein
MVYQVNGPKGPAAADKAKAKARTGAAGGPSFAEALADAQQAGQTAAAPPATPLAGGLAVPGFLPLEEDLPQNTQGQTAQLLNQLRELADAALGGNAKPNLQQLQQLANATATDEANLTPAQKAAVAEARTRAAVEAAKQEA